MILKGNMKIDENTKIIGRFHTIASPRGLNIYNPYFEETGTNAVYLLFHNKDPKVLVDGMRKLKLAGAITAGFESDTVLPTLLDELDANSKYIGKIGYLTYDNSKVVGHTQGGQGMFKTIKGISPVTNKKFVIVGAGNICKGVLFEIKKSGLECEVSIYNRDLSKAKSLQNDYSFVKSVSELSQLNQAHGDVLVNLTDIGGSEPDAIFTEEIINNFKAVVDVTFETENTNLITLAKKLRLPVATGWDMFTNQGQVCLEGILKEKVDFNILKKHVVAGLSEVVK